MTTREDRDLDAQLRRLYRAREDVPFRESLKARVLEEAQRGEPTRQAAFRRASRWASSFGLLAAGVAVALICLIAALPKHSLSGPSTQAFNQAAVAPTRTNSPIAISVQGYGLEYAPIQISDVHVGTLPGEPKNSCVIAMLRNTSTQTLVEPDLVGVLWFTAPGSKEENWLTFVNAPTSGLKPGQTVVWGFHPSGPHQGTSQALSEVPHLRFFYSRSVSGNQANLVWKQSPLAVENVQVLPVAGGAGATWQSVDVYATVWNRSAHTVDLADTRAVIWFSQTATQSFFDASAIRFLFHMTPELPGTSWPTVLKPGQKARLEFRVLSAKNTDFFSRICHVTVLDAPIVPSE